MVAPKSECGFDVEHEAYLPLQLASQGVLVPPVEVDGSEGSCIGEEGADGGTLTTG